MGLTVTERYENSPAYSMGYASFYRLRRDISYMISKEFGDHYANLPKAIMMHDPSAYDLRTAKLIRKYHCKQRLLDFLYQSDCEGHLSPVQCKAVLQLIESNNTESANVNNALYGYAAYPKRCMKISDFTNLLKECVARKTYLVWY